LDDSSGSPYDLFVRLLMILQDSSVANLIYDDMVILALPQVILSFYSELFVTEGIFF
jgi:hypothetical protein